jgi:hypothetical protein
LLRVIEEREMIDVRASLWVIDMRALSRVIKKQEMIDVRASPRALLYSLGQGLRRLRVWCAWLGAAPSVASLLHVV